MWWKLFLLTLYLTVLFVLSRILETVAYYEGGYLSSRVLNPVSLSVQRLRAILDQRGVSYTPSVEHEQLTELVKSSGEVSEEEVEAAALTLSDDPTGSVLDDPSNACTNFTCGTHFYEEVEDTRDSVWVVQVLNGGWDGRLNHSEWKYFIKKVSRFGIRTGYFDCSLDKRLCSRKKWHNTQLILDMPAGQQTQDQPLQRSYSGPAGHEEIQSWVSHSLASRMTRIHSWDQMELEWLQFDGRRLSEEKIRVVLFSVLDIPPLFLSVLSVRFTGRVRFGLVDMRTSGGKATAERLRLNRDSSTYLILTPEKNYTFGSHRGEYLSYDSMSLLLRTLHPQVNDMFLLSLIVVNLTCCLEFFITLGGMLKRFGRVLWDVVKWNFLLILLWLPVLGLFQLPYMTIVFSHMLSLLRRVSLTPFAMSVRADWMWYSSGEGIGAAFLSFVVFSAFVGIVHWLYRGSQAGANGSTAEQRNTVGSSWNFPWDSSSFLPPSLLLADEDSSNAPYSNIDMELLIERLAVPNLWLGPLVSSQYIHNLPVWKYTGPTVESDIGSDCESAASAGRSVDSDGEEGARPSIDLSAQPLMFICERCRALQSMANKSQHELEQERLESESACAKYLMDGNYKCMCGIEGEASGGTGEGHQEGVVRRRGSPRHRRPCHEKQEPVEKSEPTNPMPPGMIATMECSICLESYKQLTTLCGLPCGHCFHQHCILGWLKRDNHCCPICRWPAYKAKPCNIHQHCE